MVCIIDEFERLIESELNLKGCIDRFVWKSIFGD